MSRRHLQFLPAGPVVDPVEALRRRWDPVMAARAPAHVSLVYPEEYDDEDLLISRAMAAASQASPFTVELAHPAAENGGLGGVWYLVTDPSGTWHALRTAMLAKPFRTLQVEPHMTIVHPRTSNQGPEALAELKDINVSGKLELNEIVHTETDASGMRVLSRIPLRGSPERRMVGAVLRKDRKVLLCLRNRDRA